MSPYIEDSRFFLRLFLAPFTGIALVRRNRRDREQAG